MATLAPDWLEAQIQDQQRQRHNHHVHGPFRHAVAIQDQTLAELENSAFHSRKFIKPADPRSAQW